MKKIFLLSIAAMSVLSCFAQVQGSFIESRWVVDLNLLGGGYSQQVNLANTAANYTNGVNINTGTPGFKNGYEFGGNAQIGFFFGQKRNWGIGTGLLYLQQSGDVTLNNYHVEYQSTDFQGNTFRQLVTGSNIQEHVNVNNLNIPLVLKYKKRFSKHWGFAGDAGALFNIGIKNEYNTNASFNYEAVYAFTHNANGTQTAVYDNSPTPLPTDWLITQNQFIKNNPDGNVQEYFNGLRSQGYNVGLGIKPFNSSGTVSYATGSVGFIIQPSVNYFFSDNTALNLGVYYIFQPFNNTSNNNGYMLTNTVGDYNSMLNSAKSVNDNSYGINVGLRFFFGRSNVMSPGVTSLEPIPPSVCGANDGTIILHGLAPDKNLVVNYNLNNMPQPAYNTTSDDSGEIKITGLHEGTYTGFYATNANSKGKAIAIDAPATLVNPSMSISSENGVNPSAKGLCDGVITLQGLSAGQAVAINYNYNGTPQPVVNDIVSVDNTISLSGLCEGTYTGIVVNTSSCAANANDITLNAPMPLPPPPPSAPAPMEEKTDISTPIMFDYNKTTIHPSSYPVLDEATKEVDATSNTYIRVDGNTDAIGSQKFNMNLSVKRAMSVKKYLTAKGVNPDRIKIYGHGKLNPISTNKTAEGRAKNRRAVMHLEHKK